MSKKTPNISNEAEVAAIKEKAKSAAETFKEDYIWLMSSHRGRRIVWEYLSRCHIFTTSFNTNLSQTNFNEGERNIGLTILADVMDNAPDQYMRMTEENKT